MSSVIEVPDWYRTVALVGVDLTGAPVVVLLDSTGAIMAVMKGEYAGTLKNIAVDASGRIVSVIRDPTSDNYIAIDSNGYIAAVLKATYSGTLKNVACDSEGRIIMIPTDPADVWGNAISMGNAELAAVFSPAGRYDYRGSVIYYTGFEDGVNNWSPLSMGTLSNAFLTTTTANNGAYCIKILPGTNSPYREYLQRYLVYPSLSKLGWQVSFTLNDASDRVEFLFTIFDGTNVSIGGIEVDHLNTQIEYRDSSATYQVLDANVGLIARADVFHVIKLVIDPVTGKYERLLLNTSEYDLDAYALDVDASAAAPKIYLMVRYWAQNGTQPPIYVDDIVLTQNEPANP